jgi:hypothetical protein
MTRRWLYCFNTQIYTVKEELLFSQVHRLVAVNYKELVEKEAHAKAKQTAQNLIDYHYKICPTPMMKEIQMMWKCIGELLSDDNYSESFCFCDIDGYYFYLENEKIVSFEKTTQAPLEPIDPIFFEYLQTIKECAFTPALCFQIETEPQVILAKTACSILQ